jgi:DNA-directed RNA polymerase subunit omega
VTPGPDLKAEAQPVRPTVFGDLDGLMVHVDSKFTLVNVVTKRAKQLNNGAPPLTNVSNPNKPVSTAFEEVEAGKIRYRPARPATK